MTQASTEKSSKPTTTRAGRPTPMTARVLAQTGGGPRRFAKNTIGSGKTRHERERQHAREDLKTVRRRGAREVARFAGMKNTQTIDHAR